MAESTEHLLNHLRNVHAIEWHVIRQLERAARRRDEQTSSVYEQHLDQAQGHEQKVRELVESQGHDPSPVEDKTLRGRAIGLRQLADIALDTPVKVAMNLFAVEHLKIAAYELLAEIAQATDEEEIKRAAEEILEDQRAAAEQVEETFDRAVELLVEDASVEELLLAHLQDIHALEQQSLQLLGFAVEELSEDDELRSAQCEHLKQTEEHERMITERIEAREAKPSAVKDLHLGAARSGLQELASGAPDAHVKMALNLLCVEHLEIAGYELLIRLAERGEDSDTTDAARKILEPEREAADSARQSMGRAVELMLQSDASYEAVHRGERPSQAGDGEDASADPELVRPT